MDQFLTLSLDILLLVRLCYSARSKTQEVRDHLNAACVDAVFVASCARYCCMSDVDFLSRQTHARRKQAGNTNRIVRHADNLTVYSVLLLLRFKLYVIQKKLAGLTGRKLKHTAAVFCENVLHGLAFHGTAVLCWFTDKITYIHTGDKNLQCVTGCPPAGCATKQKLKSL